jgi:hypothetical protein
MDLSGISITSPICHLIHYFCFVSSLRTFGMAFSIHSFLSPNSDFKQWLAYNFSANASVYSIPTILYIDLDSNEYIL